MLPRLTDHLHDEACALANAIGGHTLAMTLESNDVPPLTFDQYATAFSAYNTYIESLAITQSGPEQRGDLRQVLVREADASAASSMDEQGLMQGKIDASAVQMAVYRSQVKEVNTKVQAKLSAMQLDGPSMLLLPYM